MKWLIVLLLAIIAVCAFLRWVLNGDHEFDNDCKAPYKVEPMNPKDGFEIDIGSVKYQKSEDGEA